jgi:cellulose synthase/poly-beta-1,6-N-acetylglucosamine synthase-like glycosyltransferase
MLTRALYLSLIWFGLSLIFTLARGGRIRRTSLLRSWMLLLAVILAGDAWALLTFGIQDEVVTFSVVAFVLGTVFIALLPDWNAAGQVTWTMTLLATVLFIVYAFMLTAFSPLNPISYLIAFGFLLLETITLALGLTHAFEGLDVVCRVRWRRAAIGFEPEPDYTPMVSLHVPAYNEPAEVVKQTLESLARLDYPNFEVLVIDNNTPEEKTWRPLERYCRELGPRFHCLHLDKWPGYKSGALNFALTQTDPRAEIIGIIDADYIVNPEFLRALTPGFMNPNMAFVQTPQDYRELDSDTFTEATYNGYKYFFEVSMPTRNEHNAIIFAGTMGLIRKSVLQEIGGWDEWCITEDAEASLRILKRGYESLFIHRSFGRGLMPFTFEGLKKQRFRWCFGGIQILRQHWEALMPWARWVDPSNKMTLAQRYYYLTGGLGWFTDLFNLLFACFLTLGAVFSLTSSDLQVRPLTATILIVPAIFLFLHLLRFNWVLRNRLGLSHRKALATMYNFFSLGWAVTLACIQGLVQKEGVFLRTPKSRGLSRVWRAFRVTQWETFLGLVCVTAGSLAFLANPAVRTFGLWVLLGWMGSLYLAAPIFSLIGARREAALAPSTPDRGTPVREQVAARLAMSVAMAVVVLALVFRLIPLPTGVPTYAWLLPEEISPELIFGGRESTPAPHIATVAVESANCRAAPSTDYDVITRVAFGQQLEILARNPDFNNLWWLVRIPNGDGTCWISSITVQTVGPYDDIPVQDPLGQGIVVPTSAPTLPGGPPPPLPTSTPPSLPTATPPPLPTSTPPPEPTSTSPPVEPTPTP